MSKANVTESQRGTSDNNAVVMLQLVHYGSPIYKSEKFIGISDQPFRTKPYGGLWTSPINSEWSWKDWCEAENFGDTSQCFTLNFVGTVLTIDSYKDMLKLPWIESRGIDFVSFQALCASGFIYDAIHLTMKGQNDTRFTHPKSLYGWDCETVLVMNPQSISAT